MSRQNQENPAASSSIGGGGGAASAAVAPLDQFMSSSEGSTASGEPSQQVSPSLEHAQESLNEQTMKMMREGQELPGMQGQPHSQPQQYPARTTNASQGNSTAYTTGAGGGVSDQQRQQQQQQRQQPQWKTAPIVDEPLNAFRSGRFDDSIRLLQEYEQQVAGSNGTTRFQYRHNAALAKYTRDGAKDSDRLLHELTQLFQESLNSAAESGNADGSNQRPSYFPRTCSTVGYNRAVLLYQHGQFASAAALLESLFRKGEFVHAWVAMRAGFLLLELYARTCESGTNEDNDYTPVFQKAHSLISYLHQPHVFSNAARAAALASGTGQEEKGNQELLRALITNFALKLRVYHARFAARSGHLKTVKNSIQDIMETFQKQFKPSNEAYPNADMDSVINDYSAARLDSSMLSQPGAASATENKIASLVLKASLEAWRKNYKRAANLLDECRTESVALNENLQQILNRIGPTPSSTPKHYSERGLTRSKYLNNMACLHARMKRYESAISLFARAIQTAKEEEKESKPADASAAYAALDESFLSGDFGAAAPRPSPMANLMLNAGLTYLQSRQPARALQALYQACRVHRHRPRVWLRMAEACIMAHEMKVSPGTGTVHSMPPPCSRRDPTSRSAWASPKVAKSVLGKSGDEYVSENRYTDGRDDAVGDGDAEVCWAGLGTVTGKAGFGTAQRLMVSTRRSDDEADPLPPVGSESEDNDEELLARPSLTLAYAARCLLNALVLLPPPKALASVARSLLVDNKSEDDSQASGANTEQQQRPDSSRNAGVAVLWSQFRLRQAVLTKLAYVHLCLQDHVAALHYCSQMWTLADTIYACSGSKQADTRKADPISRTQGLLRDPWRSLAHVYASEALCYLGSPREALQHVSSPNLFAGIGTSQGENANAAISTVDNKDSLTVVDVDREQRQVSRPTALCSLYANAAIALTLEGKIQEATQVAGRALSTKPTSSLARALSAYLSLVQGNHGEAAALLNRGLVQSKSGPPQKPGSTSGNVAPPDAAAQVQQHTAGAQNSSRNSVGDPAAALR
eukprot:gb/GECG01000670.1/.p1 GENE.gb/GECG01000670.1/~~gb/GECG01000670.1/.p1  ORF type:complete len:1038 (+),score=142.64 gb/GECG01000670.1/:1-3114(+)